MIRVVDLWHYYDVKPVLKGVHLSVEPGELLCVMGPNGMGKSTLIGAVAGLLAPMRGYVEIDGLRRRSSVEAEEAIRRKVVYLPDKPWLPWVTGREFVQATARVYGVPEDRLFDHTERLLDLFHLQDQADQQMDSYSAGQKKKVALCSALATDAPVLILDEPFSGGIDVSGLRALERVLKHVSEDQSRTVMMCVPVPELVENLAHRVAVIHEGQILACDTVESLRQQTGATGGLGEVLEALINPGGDAVTAYLDGERGA